MRRRQDAAGYQEVNTPELMDRSLWEASGHWDTFGENMFTSPHRGRTPVGDQAHELPRTRAGIQERPA